MGDNKGLILKIGAVLLLILGFFALRSGNGSIASLGKTILIGLSIIVVIIVAIVVLVVCLALRSSDSSEKSKGKTVRSDKSDSQSTDKKEKAAVEGGKKTLLSLRLLLCRIENKKIREAGESVCDEVDKLLKTLSEKPEVYQKARRYLSYYLPTLEKILTKYRDMEKNRIADDSMTENILQYLEDIRSATVKQHQNLYEADILDLTVEMEVMTMVCKRDGLLTDSDDDENGVGLTL